MRTTRRDVLRFGASFGLLACAATPLRAATDEDDPWPDLREALFEDRPIQDGAGVISLDAPYRAHDAAIVPITMKAEIPQTSDRFIKALTLVIDENPAPVAAIFNLTPRMGDASIATRVRVNAYTNVRVIAETNDGQLFMAVKFVKAAGGCSAPATKDAELALARMGKMKLRQPAELKMSRPNQAQLLISHPNASGLQMDQVTRHYIPAHFVQDITVEYAGETLMTIEGAISLSEDPSIHFNYLPEQTGAFSVKVRDSDDLRFEKSWPAQSGASS